MPMPPRQTLFCRYCYDPLDRTTESAPDRQPSIQRFYCKSNLATEIQGAAKYSLMQHNYHLLAQQRQMRDKVDTALLATDQQRSVLNALDSTQSHARAYTPYGHHPLANGLFSLLGFNGQRPDPITGHYHLGNGYRQFNPRLMRFNAPDSWSPFGKGGLNIYMYCGADPINRRDPSGHFAFNAGTLKKSIGYALIGAGISASTAGVALVAVGSDGEVALPISLMLGGVVSVGIGATLSTRRSRFNSSSNSHRNALASSQRVSDSRTNGYSPYNSQQMRREAASRLNSGQRDQYSLINYGRIEFELPSLDPPPSYNSLDHTLWQTTSPPRNTPRPYYPSGSEQLGPRAQEFLGDPDSLTTRRTNVRE